MSDSTLKRGRRMRPEIQALRAIAVILVVVFHFFPELLAGGFVGVDVFFVISGFLITGNLLREASRTGGIAYGRFLLRRMKRLLPASLIVLLAVSAATAAWVPKQLWWQFFSETVASTLYVENWLLAANSVDYLAAENQPSPVQHFWTLSVEEQFYLVLPLLLIAGILLGRKNWRVVVGWTLFSVFAVSLVYSSVLTASDPSVAYFSTGTRAWEFAAGSVLAFLGWHASPRLRAAASVLGMVAIAGSGILMNGTTPFPGVAASIPVLGALLVLWSGMPTGVLGHLYRLRPVQWMGGVSYSLYLWHWPLIVLFPFVVGHAPDVTAKLLLIGLALALAAASKYVVEDPFLGIQHRWQHGITVGTAWIGVVSVLLVATGSTAGARATARTAAAAALSASADHPECFGAMALRPGAQCDDQSPAPVDAAFAKNDGHGVEAGCRGGKVLQHISDGVACVYGDASAKRSMVVTGDSHAGQWVAAFDELARAEHFRLVTYVHPSCPTAFSPVYVNGKVDQNCASWVKKAVPAIEKLRADVIVDAALVPAGYAEVHYGLAPTHLQVSAHTDALARFVRSGARVIAMTDTPYQPVNIPDCIAAHPAGEWGTCAGTRRTTLDGRPQPLLTAAAAVRGVTVLDLSDYVCTRTACPAVVGGVIVYRDRHHLTQTYARSLEPIIAAQLTQLLIV